MDLFRRCMEPVEKVLRVSLLHLMFLILPAAQEIPCNRFPGHLVLSTLHRLCI